ADVLGDVATAVGEHAAGEAAGPVAGRELLLGELAQVDVRTLADGAHRPSSSVTVISPYSPTSSRCPGGTKVVESASRTIAGPCRESPWRSSSRWYSAAS